MTLALRRSDAAPRHAGSSLTGSVSRATRGLEHRPQSVRAGFRERPQRPSGVAARRQ